MNHPSGFRLVAGRVVDVHPLSALFANTYLWHELVHMYIAGYIVTGFLVAGAYAVGRLRGRWGRYERTALLIPLTIAALASPIQILVGDWAARDVATTQPIKLAALEGLGQTQSGAPVHILGWYTDNQVKYGIAIPKALSLLAFHDPNATVKGLDSVPASRRPPVNVVRVSFQTMVGIGTAIAAARRLVPRRAGQATTPPRIGLVLPCGRPRRPALAGRDDRRLDHDRGRSPAMGRLRRDAHLAGGDRRPRDSGRLRNAGAGLCGGRRRRRLGSAPACPRSVRSSPAPPTDAVVPAGD